MRALAKIEFNLYRPELTSSALAPRKLKLSTVVIWISLGLVLLVVAQQLLIWNVNRQINATRRALEGAQASQALLQQLRQIDQQLRQEAALAKEIQASIPKWNQVMTKAKALLPAGVSLLESQQQQGVVVLKGKTSSQALVAAYARALEREGTLGSADVAEFRVNPDGSVAFEIRLAPYGLKKNEGGEG